MFCTGAKMLKQGEEDDSEEGDDSEQGPLTEWPDGGGCNLAQFGGRGLNMTNSNSKASHNSLQLASYVSEPMGTSSSVWECTTS